MHLLRLCSLALVIGAVACAPIAQAQTQTSGRSTIPVLAYPAGSGPLYRLHGIRASVSNVFSTPVSIDRGSLKIPSSSTTRIVEQALEAPVADPHTLFTSYRESLKSDGVKGLHSVRVGRVRVLVNGMSTPAQYIQSNSVTTDHETLAGTTFVIIPAPVPSFVVAIEFSAIGPVGAGPSAKIIRAEERTAAQTITLTGSSSIKVTKLH